MKRKIMVLLDAGHGIDTPGKRSPDGTFREWKFNRDIAERVAKGLAAEGVEVRRIITEEGDISLSERCRRINEICRERGSGNVILVSIHSNAGGSGKDWTTATGWECFSSPGWTDSDVLSNFLYMAFAAEFPEKKMRMNAGKPKEANFYILKNSICPAVLTENFFYDNKEECIWLMRDDTRKRIATATVKGIVDYLSRS